MKVKRGASSLVDEGKKGGDAKVTKKVCGEHFYSGHFYTRLVFWKTKAAIVPKNKTVVVSG